MLQWLADKSSLDLQDRNVMSKEIHEEIQTVTQVK